MQRLFIPDWQAPKLYNLSTIIHFHLGQTPANLTTTSSPSEGRIWATRNGGSTRNASWAWTLFLLKHS